MTDITELAQSLKAAAEKATQGNWRAFQYHDGRCGVGGGNHDEIMVCEHISKERQHDAMFIAMANPANILALVDALEKANRYIERLREWNAGLAQESCERQQRISELLQGKAGSALLERENHHVEVVGKLTERIAELEEAEQKLCAANITLDARAELAERQLAELESRTVKIPYLPDDCDRIEAHFKYQVAINAAGIKVEAE